MEVFKYATSAHFKAIKSIGSLNPRRVDGFIYGLPEDPLLWGKDTQDILIHLKKHGGVSPIVLLKFVIDELDTHAFVQEGDEAPWFKDAKRIPLKDYRREHYRLPEVVVNRPIPSREISLVNPIPKLVA